MKHTKGPYFDNETFNRSGEMYILRKPNELVATVHGDLEYARLIAAAPEMYALLHALWSKADPSNKDSWIISKLLGKIDGAGGAE